MMTAHAHRGCLTGDGKMNFAPRPKGDLPDLLTAAIDQALVEHKRALYDATRGSGQGDVAKKRIGSGYIGLECVRELAYRYHKVEKEPREEYVSAGELARHAAAGDWTEANMAHWLKLAGFQLLTHRADFQGMPIFDAEGKPEQIGFKSARDPATGQSRIAGQVDGVIVAVPVGIGDRLPVPCIWESKKATANKWAKFSKNGVAGADPVYYGQLQTNMAYMEIEHTLFSILNLDTMIPYWEVVKFDGQAAQALTDRAVRVLESERPEDLPRIAKERTDWRCKFCDFKERCWTAPEAPVVPRPSWL
jgi:hypothetical protein